MSPTRAATPSGAWAEGRQGGAVLFVLDHRAHRVRALAVGRDERGHGTEVGQALVTDERGFQAAALPARLDRAAPVAYSSAEEYLAAEALLAWQQADRLNSLLHSQDAVRWARPESILVRQGGAAAAEWARQEPRSRLQSQPPMLHRRSPGQSRESALEVHGAAESALPPAAETQAGSGNPEQMACGRFVRAWTVVKARAATAGGDPSEARWEMQGWS